MIVKFLISTIHSVRMQLNGYTFAVHAYLNDVYLWMHAKYTTIVS